MVTLTKSRAPHFVRKVSDNTAEENRQEFEKWWGRRVRMSSDVFSGPLESSRSIQDLEGCEQILTDQTETFWEQPARSWYTGLTEQIPEGSGVYGQIWVFWAGEIAETPNTMLSLGLGASGVSSAVPSADPSFAIDTGDWPTIASRSPKVEDRLTQELETWIDVEVYFPPKKTRVLMGRIVKRARGKFETAFAEEIVEQ